MLQKWKNLVLLAAVLIGLLAMGTNSAQSQGSTRSVATPFDSIPVETPAQNVKSDTGMSLSSLFTPGNSGIAAGTNWLLPPQQNPDGGWGWTPGTASAGNITGPTALGMLLAWKHDGDARYLQSAVDAGGYLVPVYPRSYTDGDPRIAMFDPRYMGLLTQMTGDPVYATFAQTWFWDKLTTDSYGEANNMGALELGLYVVSARGSQGVVALSPWDISSAAIAAYETGEMASCAEFMQAVQAGLEATTAGDTYDVIGLAGAIWASAETGIDLDPTVGAYAAAGNTADLAGILAGMTVSQTTGIPYADGAWLYNSTADSTDPSNADAQTTAYAMLALAAVDPVIYQTRLAHGAAFLRSIQHSSGQFLGYPGDTPGSAGSTEVQGEVLTALITVAPDHVWVDDDWASVAWGEDPDGTGPATAFGYDAFAAIQMGVDAVAPDGVVHVAGGIYAEQVEILKNIHLSGAGTSYTVLNAPATLATDTHGSRNLITTAGLDVEISGFTMTGGGSTNLNVGIYVQGGYTNIHDNNLHSLGTSSSNIGILVGRASHGVTATAVISGNVIAGYGKGGIVIDNDGSYATIVENLIDGGGENPTVAKNGIQVSRMASAEVIGNEIIGHVWTGTYGGSNNPTSDPEADGSTGILAYHANVVTATGNILNANQFGIWSVGSQRLELTGNIITGTETAGNVYPVGVAAADADQWSEVLGYTQTETIVNVTGNELYGHEYAILVQDYIPGGASPALKLGGDDCSAANTFEGNTHNVWLAAEIGTSVDARNNDWGVYTDAQVEETLWHHPDDPTLGTIFYSPLCTPWGPPASIEVTNPVTGTESCIGNPLAIDLVVRDAADVPVPNTRVNLFATGGELLVELTPTDITPVVRSCTTNDSGECRFDWVTSELVSGTYYLRAATDTGSAESAPVAVRMIDCSAPAKVSITSPISGTEITLGDSINVTAETENYFGSPLAGQTISFLANGGQVASCSTNVAGQCAVTWTPEAGDWELTAKAGQQISPLVLVKVAPEPAPNVYHIYLPLVVD